jgi:hypothetical protein
VVAVREAIACPSGSDALIVTVIVVPTRPLAVAGAVTTGARSTSFTVMDVLAVPESALAAVKVTE